MRVVIPAGRVDVEARARLIGGRDRVLRIGHGNGKNRPSLIRHIRDVDADSYGCDEADRLRRQLQQLEGHRVAGAGKGWGDPSGRARSTAVVTQNRRENLGELTRKVSERLPAYERVAPDRVLVASFYAHPVAQLVGCEGVAHFELHPDAAVRGKPTTHPLVREYREALDSTRRAIDAARRDGLLPVLTGDLQLPRSHRGSWGPHAQLARPLGLDSWARGIDWLLWDRRLQLAGRPRVRQLEDHPGFVAKLVPAASGVRR